MKRPRETITRGIDHVKPLRLAACSALLLMCLAYGHGQTKTGTTVGQFTLIEPSARSAAMGGAGSTSMREAFAGFYNPAALGALQESDVQFAHNFWFADISLDYAVAVFRLGEVGAAGVSVTYLGSGDIDVRTVEQPLGTGERYSVSDILVGLSYGMKVTDRFFCGLQVNYVSEKIWHSSLFNFGVNIGTLYLLSADGLRIGASLTNFGTKGQFAGTDLRIRYDFDPTRYGDNSAIPGDILTDEFLLPMVFRVGLGYPVQIDMSNTLNLAIDAQHPSDNSECVNLGAEWVFRNLLSLRAGYANLFQTDAKYGFGLTAGAGLSYDGFGYDLHFDYAWANHKTLGGVHRITVGFGF